ncbi:MAG: hypothetical protein DSM106950_40145 [Stigonema ocellatum SAG 48.90 = DSM 106950]|nr:hypothetical protein [Stigonema ocellatum SAG 48.90 = DSM 106950]
MSYSQFTLSSVKRAFNLQTRESRDIFANIPQVEISSWLKQTFDYGLDVALASDSEKARSEMIIAPMLLELKKQACDINLFSGVDFNVDESLGLNGVCDFLITASRETLAVETPVLVVVEAKKENITGGLGQCIAEMYASQLFNERDEFRLAAIYGVVTTGSVWKFLKLANSLVVIDTAEYFINDPGKILGILLDFVGNNGNPSLTDSPS